MTALQPPLALENGGLSHTAEVFRQPLGLLIGTSGVATVDDLAVAAAGTPAATVVVSAGAAVIRGTSSPVQGAYACRNDAPVTLPIAANASGNARIDLVCARVFDSQYDGGSVDKWDLIVVAGTPSGTPAVPTLPPNAIPLARVAVSNGFSAITSGDITDVRKVMQSQVPSRWAFDSPTLASASGFTSSSGAGVAWATLSVPAFPFPTLQTLRGTVQCFAFSPTLTQCHARIWRASTPSGPIVAGPWMTNTSTQNGVSIHVASAAEYVAAGTPATYYGRVLVNSGGSGQVFADPTRNALGALVTPA